MIALDASALLAFLFAEPGHERVAAALGACCMSTVNLSEVLARFDRDGKDAAALAGRLLSGPIEFVAFDEAHALKAAELARRTRAQGLGLGDRACLAVASLRTIPALTADRAWTEAGLAVEIQLVRG